MSTLEAVAHVIALSLEVIKDHINDPRRRARAIANYVRGLRELKEHLEGADFEEIDRILLAIIDSKP